MKRSTLAVWCAALALLMLLPLACASDPPEGIVQLEQAQRHARLQAVPKTLLCPTSTHAGDTWLVSSSRHFRFHYLAGTPAERDLAEITSKRETAYEDMRRRLGVTVEPVLDLWLSPDRPTAKTFGLRAGGSNTANNRIEVIYTGEAGSYEMEQYGHEIAHLLDFRVCRPGEYVLAMLDQGTAEWLDQSNRNLHDAYALQLQNRVESRAYPVGIDAKDAAGSNYGRSGSLVQHLATTFGDAGFSRILTEAGLQWKGGYWDPELGLVNTPEKAEFVLARAIRRATGAEWAEVRESWRIEVETALGRVRELPHEDREELQHLVSVMDDAIATGDPAEYRATMDGFYCTSYTEDQRAAIAARVVDALGDTETRLEGAYSLGIRNYLEARIYAERRDHHSRTHIEISAEKYPDGWRITKTPDWN